MKRRERLINLLYYIMNDPNPKYYIIIRVLYYIIREVKVFMYVCMYVCFMYEK